MTRRFFIKGDFIEKGRTPRTPQTLAPRLSLSGRGSSVPGEAASAADDFPDAEPGVHLAGEEGGDADLRDEGGKGKKKSVSSKAPRERVDRAR